MPETVIKHKNTDPVIGVVGLGLIGGSMARAVKKRTGCTIIGFERDAEVAKKALLDGTIDKAGIGEDISECGIIFVALYPGAAVGFMREYAKYADKNAIVCDCCGIKERVYDALSALASEYGFTYIGGHPMAGIEKSGYEYSDADMFSGASMILCPCSDTPTEKLEILSAFLLKLGFGRITLSDPKLHDRIIAYTSQLAHVVSSAYIMSDTAALEGGFSAGSFRDMTRVAWMNEQMWAELFVENSEPLTEEIDKLIDSLKTYRELIYKKDRDGLTELISAGKERKNIIDHNG